MLVSSGTVIAGDSLAYNVINDRIVEAYPPPYWWTGGRLHPGIWENCRGELNVVDGVETQWESFIPVE